MHLCGPQKCSLTCKQLSMCTMAQSWTISLSAGSESAAQCTGADGGVHVAEIEMDSLWVRRAACGDKRDRPPSGQRHPTHVGHEPGLPGSCRGSPVHVGAPRFMSVRRF